MVKLVDTLVSGTSGFAAVQVRVLFWAREKASSENEEAFLFYRIDTLVSGTSGF